ncbi:MAG: hypothetical protein A2255_11075 [Candidatus Melainabacteria bacterium RIFOXYA2_FULL_32_9]|nr:MAG: hypothetical protein A2255_11075 [Candidatus Melainabacteria bacterium RIFOXYA2_FULL_32_9]
MTIINFAMRNNINLLKTTCICFAVLISVFLFSRPALAIRIGLFTNASYAQVAVSQAGSFVDGYTGRKVSDVEPMKVYIIKSTGSGLSITINGKSYNANSNYLVLKSSGSGFVFTKKHWYRGSLIVFNTGSGVTVVNDLDLESYMLGVVPSEMPSRWNIEAHKAQAVAARSYAIANLGKRSKYGYDLKDTPEDQAYGGASAETTRTNQAVIDTKGQVLVYGNKVIPAYYHSSSGGYTINSGAVWVKDLPFVKSVPSFDGNLPKRGHGVGMSQHGANILANYGYNAYQILGYFYQNVRLYRIDKPI